METIDFKRLNTILRSLKSSGVIYNDTDFCNKTDITKSFLSEMKNGKKQITEQTVRKISERLDINMLWLLTGEGEMLRTPKSQIGFKTSAVLQQAEQEHEPSSAAAPDDLNIIKELLRQQAELIRQNGILVETIGRLTAVPAAKKVRKV